MKRPIALLWVFIIFVLAGIANWVLELWLNKNVTEENVSRALGILSSSLDYLTSAFGVGFVIGAAVFSLWDLPVVGIWLKKLRERSRNKEQDEDLAKECEEISQTLYEEAVAQERMRNEQMQASAEARSENMSKIWSEARGRESREEERLKRQLGPRVQRAIVQLKARGIKMELWGLSLGQHHLQAASYFFADLANALREGTYLEREFKAGHAGLPSML